MILASLSIVDFVLDRVFVFYYRIQIKNKQRTKEIFSEVMLLSRLQNINIVNYYQCWIEDYSLHENSDSENDEESEDDDYDEDSENSKDGKYKGDFYDYNTRKKKRNKRIERNSLSFSKQGFDSSVSISDINNDITQSLHNTKTFGDNEEMNLQMFASGTIFTLNY